MDFRDSRHGFSGFQTVDAAVPFTMVLHSCSAALITPAQAQLLVDEPGCRRSDHKRAGRHLRQVPSRRRLEQVAWATSPPGSPAEEVWPAWRSRGPGWEPPLRPGAVFRVRPGSSWEPRRSGGDTTGTISMAVTLILPSLAHTHLLPLYIHTHMPSFIALLTPFFLSILSMDLMG